MSFSLTQIYIYMYTYKHIYIYVCVGGVKTKTAAVVVATATTAAAAAARPDGKDNLVRTVIWFRTAMRPLDAPYKILKDRSFIPCGGLHLLSASGMSFTVQQEAPASSSIMLCVHWASQLVTFVEECLFSSILLCNTESNINRGKRASRIPCVNRHETANQSAELLCLVICCWPPRQRLRKTLLYSIGTKHKINKSHFC